MPSNGASTIKLICPCRSHQFLLSPRRCATRGRTAIRASDHQENHIKLLTTPRVPESHGHLWPWNPVHCLTLNIMRPLSRSAAASSVLGVFECCVYRTSAFETGLSCLCQGQIPSGAQSCIPTAAVGFWSSLEGSNLVWSFPSPRPAGGAAPRRKLKMVTSTRPYRAQG